MSQALFYHFLGIYGYHHLRSQGKGRALYLYVVRNKKRCSNCQSSKVTQKGHIWRRIRSLPIGSKPVFAIIKMRRFYCEDCQQKRFENLVIVDRKKHYTHSMENYVMDLCSVMTVSDVAKHTGLHWNTVKEIDKKRLKRNLPKPDDLRQIRFLGIDEVSVKRGHRYLSVIVNLETGRVVYVGKNRRVESVAPFFRRLKRLGVRPLAIAMDMWPPFAKAVRLNYRGMPLVYDAFHIIADYSRTLNEIRVEEYKKLEEQEQGRIIKGSRYLLLKGQEKLSLPAREKLDALLCINRPLKIAYLLKEDQRRLWKLPNRNQAERFLNDWIYKALSSGIIQLTRFARKMRRHFAGILLTISYSLYLLPKSKELITASRLSNVKHTATAI